MTREAKIGLIVALAFLLVIGMLLSDHVTVANEETRADLTNTAGNIGAGIATPGQVRNVPEPILPEPTRGPDDHVWTPSNSSNSSTGGSTMQPVNVTSVDSSGTDRIGVLMPETSLTADERQPTGTSNPGGFGAITTLYPEDVETQPNGTSPAPTQNDGNNPAEQQPDVPEPVQPQTQAGVAVIDYVAKPGDSVSKITARVFGRWTPANQAKLAVLNPVWKDSDAVIAGRTYKLPADPSAASAAIEAATPAQASTPAAPQGRRTYTVKYGDNLWKIAKNELGSSELRQAIIDLNPKLAENPGMIRAGMKLTLPAADSVASIRD